MISLIAPFENSSVYGSFDVKDALFQAFADGRSALLSLFSRVTTAVVMDRSQWYGVRQSVRESPVAESSVSSSHTPYHNTVLGSPSIGRFNGLTFGDWRGTSWESTLDHLVQMLAKPTVTSELVEEVFQARKQSWAEEGHVLRTLRRR